MKECKEKEYNVPVYHLDGTRISNTTPSRARRLIKVGAAKRIFVDGVFSLQLLTETRKKGSENESKSCVSRITGQRL